MNCHATPVNQSLIQMGPLPFIHRLVQLMERYEESKPKLGVDKEFARIIKKAGWDSDDIRRFLQKYDRNPEYLKRLLAGSAFFTEMPDVNLRDLLTASATEAFIANLNAKNKLDAEKRAEVKKKKEEPSEKEEKKEKPKDKAPEVDRKGRISVLEGGKLVLIDLTNEEETEARPSNFNVTWRLKEGFCREPVFVTDHVAVIARWQDGRGDSGMLLEAGSRASGLPWVFDEGETVPMSKTIYGPRDPHGFLEVHLDFLEVDSPEKLIKLLQELLSAASDIGDLLKQPAVTLAAHLGQIALAIIKAITDDDGTDIGPIGRTYRTEAVMNTVNGKEETKNLKKSQWLGYDWDYDFTYLLEKG